MFIYTDGSCSNNQSTTNRGGWGYLVLNEFGNKVFSDSGSELNTTNNRMEMMAVITSLEKFNLSSDPITVFSDSKYIVDCFNQKWYENWIKTNWKNGKIKNQDLWKRLLKINSPNVTYKWVKGHASNKWNEEVDVLATSAAGRQNYVIHPD